MQPIETQYKGYRFRSRLEARWAVFFDHLGLSWQYEPEGFDLGDGVWYLPDFRVESSHHNVIWYEVKPKGTVSDPKFDKFSKLLKEHGPGMKWQRNSAILSGDPADVLGYIGGGCEKSDYFARSLPIMATNFNELASTEWRLRLAARAARQARFEHGENNG